MDLIGDPQLSFSWSIYNFQENSYYRFSINNIKDRYIIFCNLRICAEAAGRIYYSNQISAGWLCLLLFFFFFFFFFDGMFHNLIPFINPNPTALN